MSEAKELIPNSVKSIEEIHHAGFDDRIVDFRLIHNHRPEDVKAFVELIDAKPDDVILDGMDGYGSVAREILDVTEAKGYKPEIYTVDESAVQVERAKKNIPDVEPKHLVQADIRETPFQNEMFNTVVIKMGIHELPKEAQSDILKEVYRVLKPNGKFITWELSFPDAVTQKIFQDIIRKKDEIAGFDLLVQNRYFPRQEELLKLFVDVGLQNVSVAHKVDAKLSLRVRETELVSKDRKHIIDERGVVTPEEQQQLIALGKQRCDELIAFTKHYMADIPEEVRKQLHYSESENDIFFTPSKEVIVGYKS